MPLEHHASDCYFDLMRSEIVRRLFAIVLSVALATGVVVRSVQAHAMDIAAPAATAAATTDADMPMSGKCSGCAGDEKARAAGCSALCGSTVAVLPVVVVFGPISVETIGPSAAPTATGHAFPPDPYPPRPIVLG
jgi:spore maturation protein SpmB